MAVTGQQRLNYDLRPIRIGPTLESLRETPYEHAANAIAELIDNSIDAHARRVNLLIEEEYKPVKERRRWQVAELAVVDNGDGMDPLTLPKALRVGDRGDHADQARIGKFGMGLMASTLSQCKRIDVWTWQGSSAEAWHSYFDLDQILDQGEDAQLPEPEIQPIPQKWSERIGEDILQSPSGTLVTWSEIDRMDAGTDAVFNRVEQDIGRIHRHFLKDGDVTIEMMRFRGGSQVEPKRVVRPTDPLFIMRNSTTPEPWDEEGMFEESPHSRKYSFLLDGREQTVDVRYSLVKPEVLGDQAMEAGRTKHGAHAGKYIGVSIVREYRELLIDKTFVRVGTGRDMPQNRWWGCEVRFRAGCDDLFRVSYNKLAAQAFTSAAKEVAESDHSASMFLQQLETERGIGTDDPMYKLYEIVVDIHSATQSLFAEASKLVSQRRKKPADPPDPVETPEEDAERIITTVVEDQIAETGPRTDADREFEEANPDTRVKDITEFLEQEGVPNADVQAEDAVRRGYRMLFHPPLDLAGYQMFRVRDAGGITYVNLNMNHALHEFLDFLETGDVQRDTPLWRALVGVRVLLGSWARMETEINDPTRKREVQDIAMQWGRYADIVLSLIRDEAGPVDAASPDGPP